MVYVGSYSNEEINQFPEQKLSSYEKGCRQGTALSIAGKVDYIDGCMELIKLGKSNATDNGVTLQAVVPESKCMDGCKMYLKPTSKNAYMGGAAFPEMKVTFYSA